MMKKVNRKVVSAIVIGLMSSIPVSASAVDVGSMNESKDGSINISGAYDVGIYRGESGISNYTGENIVIDTTPGSVWKNGNVGVWAAYTNKSQDRAVINLGSCETNIISVNIVDNYVGDNPQIAIGLWASGKVDNKDINGGQINVDGSLLKVTGYSESGGIYGIYAQNKTTTSNNDLAEININTENTYINVNTSENALGTGDAIVAMSQGIINIDSNLEVYADNAIVARGDAVVKINESGEKTTKLNGDINFNYDKVSSGTKVDADVIVNLTGNESYWNGNAVVSWGSGPISPEDKAKVSGLDLVISDGAQWNPEYVNESDDGDSGTTAIAINKLTANDGIINLSNMKDQKLKIEILDGSALLVNVVSSENQMNITESIAKGTQLTAAATSTYAENLVQNGVQEGLQQVAQQIKDETGNEEKIAATNAMLAATSVTGVITADLNENGEIVANSIKEGVNTSNDAISNMASIALMTWRAENNDINKRMGELRDSKGEHGIWARMVRGEGTYKSIKNQYNTYQLGYDEKLSINKKWTVGAALSYTEGDSSFNGGNGENKHTGISLYGSYLNDDGSFIDLIAKYARLDHDFDVVGGAGSGSYETNGYSVSAEYGKRFKQNNGVWIEPQVELTYGKIGSANYVTDNGVSIRQDGMNSLVGRVGFALGKDFKKGNAYARVSYLYDFDGEADISFTKGNIMRGFEQDLGGSWFEVGVGTNVNINDTTHLYFDVEKTYGGDVATPWQWNAGIRYSF